MPVTGSISICEPVLGPCSATQLPAMHTTDSEPSSDDSGAGDDPHQSSTMPNSLLQLQGEYVSGSDSVVPATPEKSFDSPSTRKRGFKRPQQPWSLIKEWSLDEYDREVAYEEIKTILTQSLDEAGSKTFIKPNANSIAGWRPKQVSYAFL